MPVVVKGFAFGLQWFAAISNSTEEVLQMAKKLKANVYAEAEHDSSRLLGFGEIRRWKGVRSAAASVAEALPEGGVFIHTIRKDGTTCVIAVDGERRVPVPGMDLTGPREEMIEAAKAYINSMPDQVVKVFGDVMTYEIEGAHELELDRIASEAVISGALNPVSKMDARWVLVPLLVLGLGGVMYSDEIVEYVSPQAVAVASAEDTYRRDVKAAVDSVLQANQFPSSVMAGFLPFLETVLSEGEGWKIDGMKCTGVVCDATWRRGPGATSEGFLRLMNLQASDTSVRFPDMDTATRKLAFTKGPAPEKLVIAPGATFAKVVGTWLQGLADRGLPKANVGQMQPLVTPSGSDVAASDIPHFGQYQFTVEFKEDDLNAVASLPDLMTIESIELRREGEKKMTVQFNGKYYAF